MATTRESMTQHLEQYHLEYLAEQYEKLQNLAANKALVTEDKIDQMKRAFKSYDKDGNGVLDRDEIIDLLSNHFKEQGIKKKPTSEDVDQFFATLDDDHSGEIEFEEFKDFLIMTMQKNLMKPLREILLLNGINID